MGNHLALTPCWDQGSAAPKPVATPARALTTAEPKVNPTPQAAVPSAPPGLVAAKASPGVNAASAKSTPIKSPELKRSKKEPIASPKVPPDHGVSKNLSKDFDRAACSQEGSATSEPVSRFRYVIYIYIIIYIILI